MARLGLPEETEEAIALAASKTVALGFAKEASSAMALLRKKKVRPLFPIETDTALALTKLYFQLGLATSVESTFAVTPLPGRIVQLGIAREVEAAYPLGLTPTYVNCGLATETDEALGLV